MLYSFLSGLLRIALRVFFKRIVVQHSDYIPPKGPVIICANHPNTFMDPIVLAMQLKRPVFFLAKGALFQSAFAKWMLPKLNMIPVYRQQDNPSDVKKNDETFSKCYEHLENGGAILIFPEGVSIAGRKLKEIKTGAARIALGAEARNNFSLNVKILNVGLNYQNPHKFNQNIFINIEKPIEVKEYQKKYEADAIKAAKELTQEIANQLEKLIINIEDENTDQLVHKIEEIYKTKLSEELGIIKEQQSDNFELTKSIVDTVKYFKIHEPKRVEQAELAVYNYYKNLESIGISDQQLNTKEKQNGWFFTNLKKIFFLVLGFPVYVYGLINSFLPFEIPDWLARKITKDVEYRTPIAFAIGVFTFIIFYSIQSYFVWQYYHSLLIIITYIISLPITGFFAYYYYHTFMEMRAGWKLINFFYKKSELLLALMNERKAIITAFDEAKAIYQQANL